MFNKASVHNNFELCACIFPSHMKNILVSTLIGLLASGDCMPHTTSKSICVIIFDKCIVSGETGMIRFSVWFNTPLSVSWSYNQNFPCVWLQETRHSPFLNGFTLVSEQDYPLY